MQTDMSKDTWSLIGTYDISSQMHTARILKNKKTKKKTKKNKQKNKNKKQTNKKTKTKQKQTTTCIL